MDTPPTPRHPSLTPTSSALWLCLSTTLSNPFFKSPRALSPTAPSLLYLPSTELPMKPHNGHRKLLQYLLDATSVNLSRPALPVPDTAAESSSDSMGSLKLSECPPTNLKTAMIVVTLVVIFFLFSIFSIYVRRFANRRHPDNTPPSERPSSSAVAASAFPTKGVDRTIVGSLPVYVYRCDAEYQVDCAICLSEYEEERVKMIPSCQHVFHPECIDTWLFSHVSCPVCRSTRFFEENGSVGGGGSGEDCQTASETEGGSTVGNGDTWREEN